MELDVFEELSEPSRRYLLKELLDGPRNVSQLVESTGLKQPNVSNHLARLRARGWVRASKVGRQVYYSLARADVDEAIRNYLNVDRLRRDEVDLSELAKEYAKASIKGNEVACSEIVEKALRANHGLLPIYQDMLATAMAIVGTWYKVEAIDEGQEHMASEITERMMARVSHFYGPKTKNGYKAILACAPHNWHAIGLRMIGDYLRFAGWDVKFFGPNTPLEGILRELETEPAQMVMFSCAISDGVASTTDAIRMIRDFASKSYGPIVGAGGPAVRSHMDEFLEAGMQFSARDLLEFADEILPEIEESLSSEKTYYSRQKVNEH
jgi:MerR family transcriptional regulator, light-induced transcriptional regulator